MNSEFRALPRRQRHVRALFLSTLSATAMQAWAQTSDTPASVAASPSSSAVLKMSGAAAQAPDAPTFDMLEFDVEGNTVLPVRAVEKAVSPFLGPNKTIADAEAARAALEKAYQDAGYLTVFVDLPEQSTAGGVIRLSVLEGKVERLAVTGSHYFSQGYIRQHVPELAEGKVPNFNVVQAELADVNRTDDRRVQPILKPGHDSGTIDAELQVTDQLPLHGSVELNNDHAQFTSPWRLRGTLHYDNLFQRDHSLTLMAVTAPQDPQQSKLFSAEYAIPVDGGDSWHVSWLYSNSNVDALGAATVLGKGNTYGLHRQWLLPGTPSLSQTLNFGADYKDVKEATLAGGDSLNTPIRYMPFTLAYYGALQHEDGGLSSLSANTTFSFKRLFQHNHDCGFGDNDQFECKRSGADGGFAYLRLDARHSQPVKHWSVDLHLGGQIASQALIGAEQYALGGPDTVRGYLQAEGIGDNGVLGSLEVQTPNLVQAPASNAAKDKAAPLPWYGVTDLRLHAFADAGRVRTINASAGQDPQQTLASAGFGLRLKSRKYMSLTLDLASPLRDGPATRAHKPHAHMALGMDF